MQQVGLLLVTCFNCAYILFYPSLIMTPLSWGWGVPSMLFIAFFTAYSNWLLAGFHIVDGKMFIRYRDIMNFAFGRRMSYITWILQFINLFLNNTSFILAAGIALKGINSEFSGSPLRLQYFLMMGRSLLHLHIFSSNIIGNEKLARNLGHLHLLLHYNPCHYFGHRWALWSRERLRY